MALGSLIGIGAKGATSGALAGAGAGAAASFFTPFSAFLLSMQAAGLIINYSQQKTQKKLIEAGRQLDEAAFQTNLEALRLESNEASLAELQKLRQNIGTQIAANAAKGTDSGAGSAFFAMQKSEGAFNADERVRRFNLLAKEANLRAQKVLSGLHTLQSETQLGQAMTSQLFDKIPLSSSFDMLRRSSFVKKWFGEEVK